MQSSASTVTEYLAELPPDRRKAIQALRKVIKANLDKPIAEGMQYGMIGYFIPHAVYPNGYHCDPKQPLPFASIASQKNHIGLYLFCIYTDPDLQKWFVSEHAKTGKKLDMGKSCVRYKSLDDIPLDLIGRTIKRIKARDFIAHYEAAVPASRRKPTKKTAAKKVSKKPAARKVSKKTTKKTAKNRTTKKTTRRK